MNSHFFHRALALALALSLSSAQGFSVSLDAMGRPFSQRPSLRMTQAISAPLSQFAHSLIGESAAIRVARSATAYARRPNRAAQIIFLASGIVTAFILSPADRIMLLAILVPMTILADSLYFRQRKKSSERGLAYSPPLSQEMLAYGDQTTPSQVGRLIREYGIALHQLIQPVSAIGFYLDILTKKHPTHAADFNRVRNRLDYFLLLSTRIRRESKSKIDKLMGMDTLDLDDVRQRLLLGLRLLEMELLEIKILTHGLTLNRDFSAYNPSDVEMIRHLDEQLQNALTQLQRLLATSHFDYRGTPALLDVHEELLDFIGPMLNAGSPLNISLQRAGNPL